MTAPTESIPGGPIAGRRALTVHVDRRPADRQRTGVGHFTAELLARLRADDAVRLHEHTGGGARFHLRAARAVLGDRGAVYLSPESMLVPLLLGSRAALVVHDLTPLTHPERHTVRNRLFHHLLGTAVRRAGAVLVPSRSVADQVAQRFPRVNGKLTVIGEGPRYRDVREADAGHREILTVGTIEPRKNVPALIRAFAAAAPRGWTLTVVGRIGWLDDAQLDEFARAATTPGVEYCDYLGDAELFDRYRRADAFVCLSEAEGFGLPPLEAMACGIPVIVSSDPALVELVGPAGSIVPLGPDLEHRAAAAITRVTGDAELRARMRTAGYRQAARYSWDAAAQRVVAALTRLAP